MESNDEIFNINSLPDEMLINIFSQLSQNELGKIAQVCRRWNVLTRNPVLWKEVNLKFHNSNESANTVTRCFVNMLPPCVTYIRLHYMIPFGCVTYWTEKLNFEELCVRLQNKCPLLKTLILKHVIILESLPSVIDLCTEFLQGVKTLGVPTSRFFKCPEGRECNSDSKIEVLDFSNCYLGSLHLQEHHLFLSYSYQQFYSLQLSKMPQLRVLNLRSTGIGSRIFQAILNQGLILKELFICHTFLKDKDLNFNNSVFPHLQIICLSDCYFVDSGDIVSIIKSCQSLQKVYVGENLGVDKKSLAEHPFFVHNKSKFEIVKFSCHKYHVDLMQNI